MFNADAVIRCCTRFAGQGQGLDSEVTTRVDLAILPRYHPGNLPRWRRRKSTSIESYGRTDRSHERAGEHRLWATMHPRRKAVLISACVASARYFEVVGISNRATCAAGVMQE